MDVVPASGQLFVKVDEALVGILLCHIYSIQVEMLERVRLYCKHCVSFESDMHTAQSTPGA